MTIKAVALPNAMFKAERSMRLHEYTEENECGVSVELTDKEVMMVLDGSEFSLSARQCSELARHLFHLLIVCSELGYWDWSPDSLFQRQTFLSRYRFIQASTLPSVEDELQAYTSAIRGAEFIATGSFQLAGLPAGQSYWYQLLISLNDDLGIPCLCIEDRSFVLEFEDAFWLSQQLCAVGYLLAQCGRQNMM